MPPKKSIRDPPKKLGDYDIHYKLLMPWEMEEHLKTVEKIRQKKADAERLLNPNYNTETRIVVYKRIESAIVIYQDKK